MQKEAKETAVKRALEKLKKINLINRFKLLELTHLNNDNYLKFRYLGKDLKLNLESLEVTDQDDKDININEKIILYHFLLNEFFIKGKKKLISFRDIQSAGFYLTPFENRSIKPLAAKIQNNINKLIINLDNNYDWDQIQLGDFTAKIHVIGSVYIHLVYYLGDEEFPPSANLLFDESIKKILCVEDIVVLSSIICFKLIKG